MTKDVIQLARFEYASVGEASFPSRRLDARFRNAKTPPLLGFEQLTLQLAGANGPLP
jgi:hypothetical protein